MALDWRSTRSQAITAATCCLALVAVFVYANPFSRPVQSPIWTALLGVWLAGLAVTILDFPRLMVAVFVVSLPFGMYFAISSPSVFTLMGLFTAWYGIVAVRHHVGRRSRSD